MARIGGRNSFVAWLAGLGCAAVLGTLVVLVAPAIPAAVTLVGDTLRGTEAVPAFVPSPAATADDTSTPECRALYTEALWSELTQRVGGDPQQSSDAPSTTAVGLADALAPSVRVTCVFTGTNAGRIVTTVSEVADDAATIARTALVADGFSCAASGGGVDCSRTIDGVVEEDVVRDGLWVTTIFDGWQPDSYTARMAQQLW